MDELSNKIQIKIKIAGREYPMTISADEEERIRYAGRLVNERFKAFKDVHGLGDKLEAKVDLLVMVACDCMIEKLNSDRDNEIISENLSKKVSDLDETISNALSD